MERCGDGSDEGKKAQVPLQSPARPLHSVWFAAISGCGMPYRGG